MISIHINKVVAIQDDFKDRVEEQREDALKELEKINPNKFNASEQNYLRNVIKHFEEKYFLLKKPEELKTLLTTLGPVPPNSRVRGKRKLKGLTKFIQDALRYKSLRSSFYPEYFHKLGIKACVYCNAQFTVTVEIEKKIKANFDVDHSHPKDEYPFLSISLFNLYPCCAPCNRAKKKSTIDFWLYSSDPIDVNSSRFKFEFDKTSKAKYLVNGDSAVIKFSFKDPPKVVIPSKSLQEAFHIDELYQTQKDIAEELIIKSQIYTQSYKKSLRNNFSKLPLPPKLFERIIVGNYTEVKDIHKRPMAKFTQDIARDLKLIIPK